MKSQLPTIAIFIFSGRNLCVWKIKLKHRLLREPSGWIVVHWMSPPCNVPFLIRSTLVAVTSSKDSFPQSSPCFWLLRVRVTVPRHTSSWHCKFSIPGLEPLCYIFEDFLIMLISKKYFWSKYTLRVSVRLWKLPVFCLVSSHFCLGKERKISNKILNQKHF